MLPDNETEIAELTAMLKALSEPNRLRIFAELMTGNSCNCELEERLGLPRNLLSHHLRALSKSGLVNSRRDAVDGRGVRRPRRCLFQKDSWLAAREGARSWTMASIARVRSAGNTASQRRRRR